MANSARCSPELSFRQGTSFWGAPGGGCCAANPVPHHGLLGRFQFPPQYLPTFRDEFALCLLTVSLHFLVSRFPPHKDRTNRVRRALEGSRLPASGGECADPGGTLGLDVAPSPPWDPTFLEGNILPILGRYALCTSRPVSWESTSIALSKSHETFLSFKPVRLHRGI